MAELQDIKGIGPATAEDLEDVGYDSVEALTEADPDEIAEEAAVSDDKALEFVVQAQNLVEESEDDGDETDEDKDSFDLTPSDVADEAEDSDDAPPEDATDDSDDSAEVESEPSVESDEPHDPEQSYPIELTFENKTQYDVFHAALMRQHEDVYTGNQPAADALRKSLDNLDSFDSFSAYLTERELNELHSAVLQTRTRYQGNNLIDHMDALQAVENQVNEQRNEYLF